MMSNNPDTTYFVYLYVFTCEDCNYPYIETALAKEAPRDEIHQIPAAWTCENCNSPQNTAGYRSAVYAQGLLVKSGKCSERHNLGTQPPN